MGRLDPLQRAVDCERLMKVVAVVGAHRIVLAQLRDRWIGLGADRLMMTRAEFDQEIEEIAELHDVVLAEISHLH